MSRIGTRRALLYRPAGAASSWWQVAGQTCVAAYQPKGAASLAASYVNLANPGTYNAAPGTAPSFDTATGWTFVGASGQYLTTGLTVGATYSFVFRFTQTVATDGTPAFGANVSATRRVQFYPKYSDNKTYMRHGGEYSGTGFLSGVAAITAAKAYLDGVVLGNLTGTWSGDPISNFSIGGQNNAGGWDGAVQAFAVYSTTLTDDDVAALSTLIAAL